MPRWVLFLIGLIAVGALMWFIWGRTYTTSVKVFPPIGGTAPQSAAEAIYEKVIEQPAQEAIGFIKSIPERINQAAQDVVKQAEQQAQGNCDRGHTSQHHAKSIHRCSVVLVAKCLGADA